MVSWLLLGLYLAPASTLIVAPDSVLEDALKSKNWSASVLFAVTSTLSALPALPVISVPHWGSPPVPWLINTWPLEPDGRTAVLLFPAWYNNLSVELIDKSVAVVELPVTSPVRPPTASIFP